MSGRRRAQMGRLSSGAEVPPERLWYFRLQDWLSPEELADVEAVGPLEMPMPRGWYRAFMTYMRERSEWCAARGMRPYEIRRLIPRRVAVEESPRPASVRKAGRRG